MQSAFYRGIKGPVRIPNLARPSGLLSTSPVVVHLTPNNDTIHNPGEQHYWTISQLLYTGQLQPILIRYCMGIWNKKPAVELAAEIGRVLTDNRCPWQQSIQLSKLSKLMRSLDPEAYGHWGERYRYTADYAARVLPHIKPHQLPTYTAAQRYLDIEGDWYYIWGNYTGQWDTTLLTPKHIGERWEVVK